MFAQVRVGVGRALRRCGGCLARGKLGFTDEQPAPGHLDARRRRPKFLARGLSSGCHSLEVAQCRALGPTVILDDHDDEPIDVEELAVDGDDLHDDTAGEWLCGLRAAGFPIRADATDHPTIPTSSPALAMPGDTVAELVAESLPRRRSPPTNAIGSTSGAGATPIGSTRSTPTRCPSPHASPSSPTVG